MLQNRWVVVGLYAAGVLGLILLAGIPRFQNAPDPTPEPNPQAQLTQKFLGYYLEQRDGLVRVSMHKRGGVLELWFAESLFTAQQLQPGELCELQLVQDGPNVKFLVQKPTKPDAAWALDAWYGTPPWQPPPDSSAPAPLPELPKPGH